MNEGSIKKKQADFIFGELKQQFRDGSSKKNLRHRTVFVSWAQFPFIYGNLMLS